VSGERASQRLHSAVLGVFGFWAHVLPGVHNLCTYIRTYRFLERLSAVTSQCVSVDTSCNTATSLNVSALNESRCRDAEDADEGDGSSSGARSPPPPHAAFALQVAHTHEWCLLCA
jgi:hypothetical protein